MPPYRPDTFESLSTNADGSLGFIFDNLSRIKQLDHLVKAELDAKLAAHCRVINLRDNLLIIAADSADWATRLKFNQSQLLSKLREDLIPGLRSINIQVLPNTVASRLGLDNRADKNAKD